MPDLEVQDFGPADTARNSQYFATRNPLTESSVETRAGLLNKAEVESCRVGDRLNVVMIVKVCLRRRDCRMLPNTQARDCLGKRCTEIGIFLAAIPSPETGIDAQLHKICKAANLFRARRCAARQIAELV